MALGEAWRLLRWPQRFATSFLLHTVSHPVDSQILLEDDKSISRNHATITIQDESSTKGKTFLIKDHSQFGTCVDGDKLEKNVPRKVNAESTIMFGAGPTILRLKYTKMMFCLTGFQPDVKLSIMENVRKLGCYSTESVDEASHVVQKSDTLSITSKALLSIILGKPIVKDSYIQALVDRDAAASPLPDPRLHAPRAEKGVSTEYSPKRRDLFSGLTFVFLNPIQCEKTFEIIVKAGGSYVCPVEKVPNNSTQPGVAFSITENEKEIFSGERKKALWVDPAFADARLSTNNQKVMDKLWATVLKENFRVVDVSEIGKSILAINKSGLLPPDKASAKPADETQDLDATADEIEPPKLSATAPKPTLKPPSKLLSSTPPKAPPAPPKPRTPPQQADTFGDMLDESAVRKNPKRKRNFDVSDSSSSSAAGGENFKSFKKQKTQEATDAEIVKVAKVVANAQSAIQEVFMRETEENREGEALFAEEAKKTARKKR